LRPFALVLALLAMAVSGCCILGQPAAAPFDKSTASTVTLILESQADSGTMAAEMLRINGTLHAFGLNETLIEANGSEMTVYFHGNRTVCGNVADLLNGTASFRAEIGNRTVLNGGDVLEGGVNMSRCGQRWCVSFSITGDGMQRVQDAARGSGNATMGLYAGGELIASVAMSEDYISNPSQACQVSLDDHAQAVKLEAALKARLPVPFRVTGMRCSGSA